jgi:hypothetical protein
MDCVSTLEVLGELSEIVIMHPWQADGDQILCKTGIFCQMGRSVDAFDGLSPLVVSLTLVDM